MNMNVPSLKAAQSKSVWFRNQKLFAAPMKKHIALWNPPTPNLTVCAVNAMNLWMAS